MLYAKILHGQAWTNVARTDVAWANVAWTNDAWSNGTGPLVNSQGWFHKLEMLSKVLSLGGCGGGEKLKLMLSQPSTAELSEHQFKLFPTHPPGKVLWRTFKVCGTILDC